MKHHRFKRLLSLVLVAALLAGFAVPTAHAASTGVSWKETDQKVQPDMSDRIADNQVEERYQPNDMVRVSIVLEDKPTIQAGHVTRNIAQNNQAMSYSRSLRAKQDTLANTISNQVLGGKKLDVVWNLTLAANLISANVPYGKIEAIAQLEGVKTVILETKYAPCVVQREDTVAQPQMFASLGMTGSSLVWSGGFTGAGSRIAVIDTGTDTNHQSLDSDAFLYALQQNAEAAGISFDAYLKELDLLDQQEIASVLPYLNINDRISGLTADKLYLNEKLPFAVNYVDCNLVVDHEHDYQGEHGSHVAGIATANRYIPSGNSYVEALETVMMAGMAPDAQLITLKVFGNAEGPYDADYMAAVEDAIYLGCDSVNLSLGSGNPGSAYNPYFSDLLEYMTQTDTVVVASAGNSFNWPMASAPGYLYSDDVSMATGGSPGSHTTFFTVASVENAGGNINRVFQAAGKSIVFLDGAENNYCAPFRSLDTSDDSSGTDYEYIFIDSSGHAENYAGMDLEGKIVFCSRGEMNFGVKANNAVGLGAAATVIYNYESGFFGMDLTGYNYSNPCVSISQEDADLIRATSVRQSTADGLTYYTGTMTVLGQDVEFQLTSQPFTMSDFSSWGVPGDLSLKPEITAPGGNIYSLYGEGAYGGGPDQYELMSGTSMAAPAITGIAALMAQYLRESGLAEQEGISVRKLTQSLLMSTAVPIIEEASGNYYSLLKQGAGLARVDLAVAADSYILVNGQSDGKVKAELGDDPNRTGVYEFSFSINNLSGEELSYALSADVFCQNVFSALETGGFTMMDSLTTNLPAVATFFVNGKEIAAGSDLSRYDLNGDGSTNAADADYLLEYLLGNESEIQGTADVNGNGTVTSYDAHALLALLENSSGLVTVPADGSVTVNVRLALTASGKQFLDTSFPNGSYVQAFVHAESISTEEGLVGTAHSIPVLAFYGNWSDASMYDKGTAVEYINGLETRTPYLYQINGTNGNTLTINYGDGEEYIFGGNPYVLDDVYMPERNAFNNEDASRLVALYFAQIRNAGYSSFQISNADTGEIYSFDEFGEVGGAFYYVNAGSWYDTQWVLGLEWSGTDADGNLLPEGTNVDMTLTTAPEYYRNADGTYNLEALGKGVALTTSFTIDNTAPEVIDVKLDGTMMTVEGLDNRHVAAVMLWNAAGTTLYNQISANQIQANAPVSVQMDLANVPGKSFLLSIHDYAGNETTYELDLSQLGSEPPVSYVDSVTLDQSECSIPVGQTVTLTAQVNPWNVTDDSVTWTSSNRSVATVDANGVVTAVAPGTATITATSNLDPSKSASCTVTVTEPKGGLKAVIWDDAGEIWWSSFDMENPSSFNKLSQVEVDEYVNATMVIDGRIYASVLDTDNETSEMYRVDPDSYDMTYVGYSDVGFMDMAYAPSLGYGLALYYGNILMVNPYTGDYESYWNWSDGQTYELVGITYYGTEYNSYYGEYMDYFLLLDAAGQVFLEAFMPYDGDYYYFNGPEEAYVDRIGDFVDLPTYQGFYYDGTYTYWARFNAEDNMVELLVWDCDDTGYVYDMGTFGYNVWPVTGLYTDAEVNGTMALAADMGLETASVHSASLTTDIPAVENVIPYDLHKSNHKKATGGLNSFVPLSSGDFEEENEQIVVTLTGVDTAPNGLMTVTYDPTAMSFTGISGETRAFAYTVEEGKITVAFAAAENLPVNTAVATLTFEALKAGTHTITINHQEAGDSDCDLQEILDVEIEGEDDHEHEYEAVVTDPTCTEKGYTTYTCSCGHSYVGDYVDALDHDWDDGVVSGDDMLFTCRRCGATKTEPLSGFPFTEEEWEVIKLVNRERMKENLTPLTGFALFQQAGDIRAVELVTLFSHDRPDGSSCFSVLDELGIPYNGAGENIAAGQTTPNAVMTAWMNSSGHRANILTPEFKHITVGYHYAAESYYRHHWVQMFAQRRGEEYTSFTLVFPSGQTFDVGTSLDEMGIYATLDNTVYGECYLPIIEEFCTGYDANAAGDQEVTVSVLGYEATFIISRGGCSHDYTATVTAPTCTEEGYTTYTCTRCGDSYVDDYVDVLDHDMGEWEIIEEATCDEAGLKQRACSRCDHVETEEIPTTDHDYKAVVVDPTCTEQGYTIYTCTICGHSYVDDYVDALDHDMGEWEIIKQATCNEKGLKQRMCSRCLHIETKEIPSTDHDYKAVVVDPTCTEEGYTIYTCTICGHSYVDDYVDALDHNMGEWVIIKEASCSETGLKQRVCRRCDHIETEEIPVADHEYEDGHCKWCGEEEGTEQGLWGDVNGDGKVNHNDARLVLQYYVGIAKADSLDLKIADVNGDGKINHNDARLILQYYVGIITSFPAED